MNTLTLAARYRNARKRFIPFNQMSPALRCMTLIQEYRQLRDIIADGDDFAASWAESSIEYTAREFAAAHEELRSAIRFNNAVEAA